ncbi:unnamed protein product [Cuscuta epithymum]|uniref:Uncharacterized protein n=1 Tax=Cuscuta epithymum TaxID=186058 RepID=A0AAV0DS46_9ASTE|nr:unnamed protein product [Cuscuta epithymum]
MLVLVVLALLILGMNTTRVVFDPGGTMSVWLLVEGENLKSIKVGEGLARMIRPPQVVEEEDDMRKLHPPPELPPSKKCLIRLWNMVLGKWSSLFYKLKFGGINEAGGHEDFNYSYIFFLFNCSCCFYFRYDL